MIINVLFYILVSVFLIFNYNRTIEDSPYARTVQIYIASYSAALAWQTKPNISRGTGHYSINMIHLIINNSFS